MCYLIELIIFCTFSLTMFFAGVGASVTKGNSNIFHSIPYYQTVLICSTAKQHQNNTKSEPQSEQQQDRARAIITYRCCKNKTVRQNRHLRQYSIFFIQFFPSFAQKFKNSYERDTFHNSKRDTNHPPVICWNTETVIQITHYVCYLWK